MKTISPITILALACGTGLLLADDKKAAPEKKEAVPAVAKTVTAELHVTGMSCHNCSDSVEDALAAVKGVEVIEVDSKRNLAIVKYVPEKMTHKKMAEAVKGSGSYVLEKSVSYKKLEYENDGSFSLEGKPFTGTATDVHRKSGNKSKNYQFKEGKLNGLIREWYDNGKMSGKKFYKEGKRHGKTEYWDEKGELTATKIYKDDVHVDEKGKAVEE